MTSILRNLPQLPEFVVEWNYPLMKTAVDLNPEALRRPQSKRKVTTDKDFMETVLGDESKAFGAIVRDAGSQLKMSRRTTARYLNRLLEAGLIAQASGLYWVASQTGSQEGK